jgi:transposase
MKLHANARTCPKSRRLLVERLEEESWSLAAAAEAAGVSERTAAKWRARWRAEGEAGLKDRSSAPKRRPTQLPASRVQAIEALRRLRMTAAEIAECLGMALSTVSRWLKRVGLGKRSRLEAPEPPNRYERRRPGELVHLDVKKLGRILRPGHRVTGNRRDRFTDARGYGVAGWEFVHVCVDDATRLAYVEVLEDERGKTAAGFPAASRRVVRLDGDHRRGGDERQRLLLPLAHARQGLPGTRSQAPLHPALSPSNQWQGRAVHPDASGPLGLRRPLRQLSRTDRSASRLAHPLQLHSTTWLPRPPPARSSARRAGTTSWVATASRGRSRRRSATSPRSRQASR